ncbi:hypothetical protein SCP_0101670 [Sparassis crispa]|uniref:Uncharacterized protein n=1 Tax=Sparassis crispa TaxID=139825 RepID=A0A401G559_9APHY|nr:hypothetical protein SCP_0101670 [Sparassis crispa]GBE77294.1 hypothetical protein SCP_0101670 [Sparassis crispa]
MRIERGSVHRDMLGARAQYAPPSHRPRLRRIHLACKLPFFSATGSTQNLQKFLQVASSNVTHLRITVLPPLWHMHVAKTVFDDCVELEFLEDRLRECVTWSSGVYPNAGPEELPMPRILPDSLQVFALQPPPFVSGRNEPVQRTCLEEQELSELYSAMEQAAGGHFVYIPSHNWGPCDAEADWLDRICGRPGCWKDREDGKTRLSLDMREQRPQEEDIPRHWLRRKFLYMKAMLKKLKS